MFSLNKNNYNGYRIGVSNLHQNNQIKSINNLSLLNQKDNMPIEINNKIDKIEKKEKTEKYQLDDIINKKPKPKFVREYLKERINNLEEED